MENEIRVMNGGSISISNDIGNVIELNDINDSLGLNMLTNNKFSSPTNSNSGGLAEVEISSLDAPVSININDGFSMPSFQPEIRKEQDYSSNIFQNSQTSSSMGVNLDMSRPKVDTSEEM